jgi:hypothetical protein
MALGDTGRSDLAARLGMLVEAVWIAGYHLGYRRGVKDALTDDIIRAEHRITVD